MTFSIWDMAVLAAWVVLWFTVLGLIFTIIGAAIKKRKQRTKVLSAAALALTEKLKKSVYTQEEFNEIVRMMEDKNDNGSK